MIKSLQHHSETHLTACTLPGAVHKFSSDEAKHTAISAQQGLKVKHMLKAFMSDIVKECICYKDASLSLKRCLLKRAHPTDLVSCTPGTSLLNVLSGLGICVRFFCVCVCLERHKQQYSAKGFDCSSLFVS